MRYRRFISLEALAVTAIPLSAGEQPLSANN
jgi:hypothetical protein